MFGVEISNISFHYIYQNNGLQFLFSIWGYFSDWNYGLSVHGNPLYFWIEYQLIYTSIYGAVLKYTTALMLRCFYMDKYLLIKPPLFIDHTYRYLLSVVLFLFPFKLLKKKLTVSTKWNNVPYVICKVCTHFQVCILNQGQLRVDTDSFGVHS